MTPQEHIEYLFNNCIVIYDKYYYDESYIRDCKINSLMNIDKPKFSTENSIILFEQDFENGYFWYDYHKIYLVFEQKYGFKHKQINDLIKVVLNNYQKLNTLNPGSYKRTPDTRFINNQKNTIK